MKFGATTRKSSAIFDVAIETVQVQSGDDGCPCVEARERAGMIQLTRLNKKPLVVNSDLIEFIENTPDTVITLVTGEKVVVLEGVEEILDQVVQFRQRFLSPPMVGRPSPIVLYPNRYKVNENE